MKSLSVCKAFVSRCFWNNVHINNETSHGRQDFRNWETFPFVLGVKSQGHLYDKNWLLCDITNTIWNYTKSFHDWLKDNPYS